MRSFDIRPKRARLPAAPPVKQPATSAKPKSRSLFSGGQKFIAAVISIVLCLIFLASYIFPEATIYVEARTEPVTRDMEIRVDVNQAAPNTSELAVPGKILEKEVSGKKTFAATGSKNVGKKASGFVSIYNFSKTTLILKAQTTVLTRNGKKYFFVQDATGVRPTAFIGQKQEQEIDPTSLVAPLPVVAENPGVEYNLPKDTRLQIANEVFGSKPEALYAVAAEAITGGTNKDIKVVTDADIASAYDSLVQDLVKQTSAALGSDTAGLKLLDSAIKSEVVEKQTSTPAGTEISEFEVSLRVRQKALVYNQSEIIALIQSRISRLLPEDKQIVTRGSDRLDSQFKTLDLATGVGTLASHFEGQVVYKLDAGNIAEKLKGKTAAEIKEILLSSTGIASVVVKFWPVWVKKASKIPSKIHIFEKS